MGGEVLVPAPLLPARIVLWRRIEPEAARRAERLEEPVVGPEFQSVGVQVSTEHGRLDHDAIAVNTHDFHIRLSGYQIPLSDAVCQLLTKTNAPGGM